MNVSFYRHYCFPDNLFIDLEFFSPTFSSPRYQAVSFCVSADQPNGRRHGCRAGQATSSEDQRAPWVKGHQGPATLRTQVPMGPLGPAGHTELFILFLLSPVPAILLWAFWHGWLSENTCCWQRAFTWGLCLDGAAAKWLGPLASLAPTAPHVGSVLFKQLLTPCPQL